MSLFRKKFREPLHEKSDGRNIRPEQGLLTGEGAQQKVKNLAGAFPAPGLTHVEPLHATLAQEGASYYGRPLVKAPVWIWSIPVYFYVGGVAGAAGTLAAAAQLSGDEALRPLVRKLRWVNAIGSAIGGGLLVYDLGRPSRFLNMLRVFRPTSPMSMGSWLLAGLTPLAGAAALLGHSKGRFRDVGEGLGLAAAAVSLPFTGYTAVLIANTAIPVWQGAHKTLPVLFITSSMASLASFTEFLELTDRERRIARRFGIIGRVGELLSAEAMKRELALPEVKKPLGEGAPGMLLKAGKAMSVASLALSLLPGRFRSAHRAGGVLGTLSVLALKGGIFLAGRTSAKNPQASFQMQREGRGAAEIGPASSNLVQLKVEGRPLAARPIGVP